MSRERTETQTLRREIDDLLASLKDANSLQTVAGEAVSRIQASHLASGGKSRPWSLLPLIVTRALSGDYRKAVPLAASLELLKAAAEVLDDVEDADSSASLALRYGPAVATNAATALIILAEKALSRLARRGVENARIVRIFEAVNSFYIKACAGQHLDLSLAANSRMSEGTYLRIVSLKSATAAECACATGALLATDSETMVHCFGVFGQNLGMACQIANDIQGINSGVDITNRRMTLPIIYALAQTEGDILTQFEDAFIKMTGKTVLTGAETKDLLVRTGAIQYATVKMEYYRQRALESLNRIKAMGADVENLFQLVA